MGAFSLIVVINLLNRIYNMSFFIDRVGCAQSISDSRKSKPPISPNLGSVPESNSNATDQNEILDPNDLTFDIPSGSDFENDHESVNKMTSFNTHTNIIDETSSSTKKKLKKVKRPEGKIAGSVKAKSQSLRGQSS